MSTSFFHYIWPLVLIYLVINGLFFIFQKSLLFFPNQSNLKFCPLVNSRSIEYYEKENVRFLRAKKENAKANLIVFHGNAGSACDRGYYIEAFSSLPINVILAEYPGYADGGVGELSQKSFLNSAKELMDLIQKKNLPLFIYGESLGTGVATYLASENKVDGLLLNNAFTSISDIAKFHYPFMLIDLLNVNTFNSKKWAKKVNVTPIIFQGTVDNIIPLENVEIQVKNFKNKPIFIRVGGAGHNDLLNFPIVFERGRKYILDRL